MRSPEKGRASGRTRRAKEAPRGSRGLLRSMQETASRPPAQPLLRPTDESGPSWPLTLRARSGPPATRGAQTRERPLCFVFKPSPSLPATKPDCEEVLVECRCQWSGDWGLTPSGPAAYLLSVPDPHLSGREGQAAEPARWTAGELGEALRGRRTCAERAGQA